MHEFVKLERSYKQFVNVFTVGYCPYLVYCYYYLLLSYGPYGYCGYNCYRFFLWLLCLPLFEWNESIINYFMYSQSENLCNKKLRFVSLAQNFVSCHVSCVAPFHFLLLS
jgi:hypothetical protein